MPEDTGYTPEQAIEFAMKAGSPEDALAALQEYGFELSPAPDGATMSGEMEGEMPMGEGMEEGGESEMPADMMGGLEPEMEEEGDDSGFDVAMLRKKAVNKAMPDDEEEEE